MTQTGLLKAFNMVKQMAKLEYMYGGHKNGLQNLINLFDQEVIFLNPWAYLGFRLQLMFLQMK